LILRIVYVTQGYPPERVGGVETYLKRLAREVSAGHEVYVFSRGLADGKRHGDLYETEEGGIRLSRVFVDMGLIGEFRDIYMRPWLEGLFGEYLKRIKPDAVHFQHLGGLSLGMIETATSLGIPAVATLSDHQPYCPRGQRIRDDKRICKTINLDECLECIKPQCAGLPNRATKLAAYLLGKRKGMELLRTMHDEIAEQFGKVSTFIMPSEFHRDRMVEAGVPEDRSVVLAYGLSLKNLDQVPPRPEGEPVRKFAYLGTMIPSKGVEDMIRAFKKMKTKGCSLHLWGESVPYHGVMDYDKRLAEMAGSADVTFHGPYQPEDLVKVLAEIDAVVMPSVWYESYGITIREAFRARRPVIVSDVGAFSEAVDDGENGLKFPPGDVFELAIAMDRLASDVELAQSLAGVGGPVASIPEHAAALVAIYRDAGKGD